MSWSVQYTGPKESANKALAPLFAEAAKNVCGIASEVDQVYYAQDLVDHEITFAPTANIIVNACGHHSDKSRYVKVEVTSLYQE